MEKELNILSLDADASTAEIRSAYLKLTFNKKFNKVLLEDPPTRNEFVSIYQAYVTLMKHRSEGDSIKNLELYPQDQIFQLQFNQGVYLALTQQWIKAGEKFQEAFVLNKSHSLLQTYLGIILLKRKNEYAAEKYFIKAIDINPNNTDAWLYLGDVYLQTGNLKKARSIYQSAADISGNSVPIQKRLQLLKQKELNPESNQANLISRIKKIFG